MNVQDLLHEKLTAHLEPEHLEVENESHRHRVPAGAETHFRVVIVSDRFAGLGLMARHRLVHEVLAEELAGPLHALSIQAYSPEEWRAREGRTPDSPPCLGGERGRSRMLQIP